MTGPDDPDTSRCRFISSYDGVSRCAHEVFAQFFCRYHYRAFLEGEITQEGYIDDALSDQVRRREINFHGIEPAGILVGAGSEPTPCVERRDTGAAGRPR